MNPSLLGFEKQPRVGPFGRFPRGLGNDLFPNVDGTATTDGSGENTTSPVVYMPDDVQVGDLLMMAVSFPAGPTVDATVWPTGWTHIAGGLLGNQASRAGFAWKRARRSDRGAPVTLTVDVSGGYVGAVARIGGAGDPKNFATQNVNNASSAGFNILAASAGRGQMHTLWLVMAGLYGDVSVTDPAEFDFECGVLGLGGSPDNALAILSAKIKTGTFDPATVTTDQGALDAIVLLSAIPPYRSALR